ncbi:MAG: hypothetical protein PHS82_03140 [Lachnospiraceae bacterium]|nr:hypothetical protein [Lachnospiraceae bacterium]
MEEYLNIDEILKEQLLKVMEEKMELAEMKKALISKVNYLLAVIPECSEAQSFKNYLKSLD